MNFHLKTGLTLLAAVCTLSAVSSAFAQSAGQFTAKIGAAKITPKVDSGDVSAPALPGSKVDIGSDTKPVLIFAYGITDNISAELDLGVPYTHKIYGAGAIAGTGHLGTVQVLPPSAFIQYRFFKPEAVVRPYLGLGATYAYFRKETGSAAMTALLNTGGKPTSFSIGPKLSATMQAGVAVNINARWFVDVMVVKSYLEVETHYSTGQMQKVKLNPFGVIVAVGYKF